jgi:pseudouridine kinase
VLDGNLAPETIGFALDLASASGTRVVLEPVSVPKAAARAHLLAADRPVHVVTPNRDELGALTGLPVRTARQVERATEDLHERGVELVWVRLGAEGSLLSTRERQSRTASLPAEVVDVTGAGDAMLAGFCHALLRGAETDDAAAYGHAAAALTVASPHTVRPDLTDRLVRSLL